MLAGELLQERDSTRPAKLPSYAITNHRAVIPYRLRRNLCYIKTHSLLLEPKVVGRWCLEGKKVECRRQSTSLGEPHDDGVRLSIPPQTLNVKV